MHFGDPKLKMKSHDFVFRFLGGVFSLVVVHINKQFHCIYVYSLGYLYHIHESLSLEILLIYLSYTLGVVSHLIQIAK